MIETAVCLGPKGGLIGIYTEPAVARDNAPAVLFLTAGITHRSGPFRLHVDIARRLAQRGYACLRVDLAGIGDSDGRERGLSEQEGTQADARLAMDFLQSRTGAKRLVLFGLCSGADDSHSVALRDARVAGIIGLDGFAYPSRFRLALRQAVRQARRPGNVYRKAISRLRASWLCRTILGQPPELDAETRAQERVQTFQRDFPPRDAVAEEIAALLRRGVHLLYIYSGGYKLYNYKGQFFDEFPNVRQNPGVEVEYFGNADHTYMLLADRDQLIRRIEAWLDSRFPDAESSDPTPAMGTGLSGAVTNPLSHCPA